MKTSIKITLVITLLLIGQSFSYAQKCRQYQRIPKSKAAAKHYYNLTIERHQIGGLLKALPYMPNLTNLEIVGCPLDQIPKQIYKLPLTHLSLIEGKTSCDFPLEITQMKTLEHLWLSSNNISNLPEELFGLTNLKSMVVSDNRLTKLSPSIKKLKNLKFLDIGHNGIKKLPKEIGLLSQLEHLNISSNWLEYVPSSIGELTNLTELQLVDNNLYHHITGINIKDREGSYKTLPESFCKLKKLKKLDLPENLKALPTAFGELDALEELTIPSPMMTLPISFGNLKSLKKLTMNSDSITFHRDFGNLAQLEEIYLHNSAYRCIPDLPETFGNLSNLKVAVLGHVGKLPNSMTKLKKLKSLSIQTFHYDRTLPPILQKLSTVEKLTLYGVNTIPKWFYEMDHLTHVNFENADLHRSVKYKMEGKNQNCKVYGI